MEVNQTSGYTFGSILLAVTVGYVSLEFSRLSRTYTHLYKLVEQQTGTRQLS